MKDKILFKEVVHKTGKPIAAIDQTDPYLMLKVVRTDVVKATKKEILESKQYFKEHKKCQNHLIYDIDTFMYYSRYCGICGHFIAFI